MSLNFLTRNHNINLLFQECMAIMKDKGPSYAGTGEANENFYQIAEDLGLDAQEVWGVYFYKHLRSLSAFLKDGRETSEGVQENIKDMINYLAILTTMIDDNWGDGSIREQVNELMEPLEQDVQNTEQTTKTHQPPIEPPLPMNRTVTVSQQRANYRKQFGNETNFIPDLELAGVSDSTAEVN